ncbi:MAG: hypothetical protein IKL96_09000 [Kiritimatiellae bacterium]|nr:hypothetical protein [Kiritimatiellia bacterium]
MNAMKNPAMIKIAAVAALILATAWFMMSSSDEKRIQKQFDRVAELFLKEESESMLAAGVKAKSIGAMVMPKTKMEVRELGLRRTIDSDEASEMAAVFRAHLRTISIKFSQLTIDVKSNDEADVIGNATLSGSMSEERSFEASLVKDPETDEWKFSSVKLHRVN